MNPLPQYFALERLYTAVSWGHRMTQSPRDIITYLFHGVVFTEILIVMCDTRTAIFWRQSMISLPQDLTLNIILPSPTCFDYLIVKTLI